MRPSRVLQADPRHLGLGVFLAALGIRLLYLADIRANPFFRSPVIDAEFYHNLARSLAQGFGAGSAPFQMPPLYPLLLSLVYRVTGPNWMVAHVVQIVIGAGSVALVWAIGRRLGGAAVGLLAAGIVATSKSLLYIEGDLLATPLSVCLDLACVLFLVRFLQDGAKRREIVFAGLATGLSALALPSILIILPVLAAWLAWRRGRAAAAGWFVLATLLPIVPVTLRNLRVSGEFVPISTNAGINFYMGNNPDLAYTAGLRPGADWRRMQEMPLREAGLVASSARDRWFTRRGLRFWVEDPGRAAAQTLQKVLLLMHNHEIMRDFDFYYFCAHFSRLLRLPGWNFAMLLAFGLVGLFLAGEGTAAERVVQLVLAAYAAGVVLFFVTARYRAPLVPLVGLFAARGVLWVVARVRERAGRRLAVAGAVAAGAIVISCLDFFGVDTVDEVEAQYRVATAYEKAGKPAEALRRYDEVLKLAPGHEQAAGRSGVCLQLLGRDQEAVERYETLLERHPDNVDSAVNLANLAWQHGDPSAAAHFFDLALRNDPYLPQAHGFNGLFLLDRGETQRALAELQQALTYDPSWQILRIDYARALLVAGDLARARSEIERTAAAMPPTPKLELVRGDILQAAGRSDEARAAWQRGLRLGPSNTELRARLGSGAGAARRSSPADTLQPAR